MRKTKLWEQVDRILWGNWDPIGNNDSGPKKEYSGYEPSVIKFLNQDTDEHKIAKFLLVHANINMGGSTRLEKYLKITKKLKQLTSTR